MAAPETREDPVDYVRLQDEYGGMYVATKDGKVIARARRYSELADALEAGGGHTEEVVVEYVRPKDRICAY
jgi:hypothetical protein